MKAKCIRLFTLNLYVFYFLLLCIQKGLTITTNHEKGMHHTLFRHERHYKSSGLQPSQHQQPQRIPTTGINEAVHAFHPSNNLHLFHSLQHKYHSMRSPTTTTTRRPFTTRQVRHTNYIQHPTKSFAITNNNQISLKLHNHSIKPPFRYTTLISMSPSTVAPENSHRNSLTHDEHIQKRNKVENMFFTSSKYRTTRPPVLSKSSVSARSITKSIMKIPSTPQPRTIYRWGEEQDDYFNEFNEKNYRSDTFTATNDREIIADGNRGKEMNLKNVLNDDDNEETEEEEHDDEDDEEYEDYLDDESTLDESSQIGSLTKEKWENYGTSEAVEKSRQQIAYRSIHEMAVHNATAHISRIYTEALCKYPRPKIIPIVAASKTYVPHCTVLHRCGDDTGCCHTDALTCVPKRTATVDLYFYVSTLGKREPAVESLTFINHTECHCINRHAPLHNHYSSNQHPYDHAKVNNSTTARDIYTQSGINNHSRMNNCQCVKHYKVFYERVESSDEDDEMVVRNSQLCRCDCDSENVSCDWLKKGKDGFSIEDRRCIVDKRCIRPTCEYGQYSMQIGRCPKLEDKLAGARNLFFD